jgi:hypothetical protein
VVLQDVLDARRVAPLLDIVGIELDIAAVEHGVLRGGDIDKSSFHAGQDVLDPPEIDVPVNLADIVGWPGHVVLDEAASLEHRDLRDALAHLNAHEIAADGLAVALTTTALLHHLRRELRRASASSTATASTTPSALTRALLPAGLLRLRFSAVRLRRPLATLAALASTPATALTRT